jgi:hypothetical protein
MYTRVLLLVIFLNKLLPGGGKLATMATVWGEVLDEPLHTCLYKMIK